MTPLYDNMCSLFNYMDITKYNRHDTELAKWVGRHRYRLIDTSFDEYQFILIGFCDALRWETYSKEHPNINDFMAGIDV